jgi:autotransporter-associated beta strand protein
VLTLTSATFNGGVTQIGAPATPAGIAAAPALPLNPAAPAPPVPGSFVTSTAQSVTVAAGDNSVQAGALLVVGAQGLTFRGGGTPTLTLAAGTQTLAPGTVLLNGDIFVNDANTFASITGGGLVDLNGARIITPDPATRIVISAGIANGSFTKEGQGTLRMKGFNRFLAGGVTVTGGAVEAENAAALPSAGPVRLNGGSLRLLTDDAAATFLANIFVSADAALDVDRINPDPQKPSAAFAVASLRFDTPARLTVGGGGGALSVNGTTTLAANATIVSNAPLTLGTVAQSGGGGAFGLVKDGFASTRLTGATANTFAGATTVVTGELVLAKSPGVTAIPAALTLNGRSIVRLEARDQIADAAAVTLVGGTLDLGNFHERVGSITLQPGATVINAAGLEVTGAATINGGSLTFGSAQRLAALTVSANGAVGVESAGAAGANPRVFVTAALTLTGGGRFDVTDNCLVVDYAAAAASPIAAVRAAIVAGYGGPSNRWAGAGINSSTAASAPENFGVGYAPAADVLAFAGGVASFAGQDVDATCVLARYTLLGDANLDAVVDFNDLVRLAQNYNTTPSQATNAWWSLGDSTYDGVVDFNDLVKLAQNYNAGLPSQAIPGAPVNFGAELAAAFATVPEPSAAVAALGLAATGLALRPRRRAAIC